MLQAFESIRKQILPCTASQVYLFVNNTDCLTSILHVIVRMQPQPVTCNDTDIFAFHFIM